MVSLMFDIFKIVLTITGIIACLSFAVLIVCGAAKSIADQHKRSKLSANVAKKLKESIRGEKNV